MPQVFICTTEDMRHECTTTVDQLAQGADPHAYCICPVCGERELIRHIWMRGMLTCMCCGATVVA